MRISETKIGDQYVEWKKQHDFFANRGNAFIQEDSNGQVEMDTSKVVFSGHSAGGHMMKKFALEDPTLPSAIYFNDPVFKPNDEGNEDCDAQVTFPTGTKVIVHSTELCARCCTAGNDFAKRMYDSLSGADIKQFGLLEGEGHCSILDWASADLCRISHFCIQNRESRRELSEYHNCMVGMSVAMFNDALFGREDLRKWYDNEEVYKQECQNFLLDGSWNCDGDCK